VPTRAPLLLGTTVAVGVVALTAIALLISNQVQAGPPPAVTFRDAISVRDAGQQIGLPVRALGRVQVVEPRTAVGDPVPTFTAAPDGATVAISPVAPGQSGPLVLAHADGSQVEVALPGVRGAAFSPDGTWLAVVDGAGALWRVDAASGAATILAEGPFGPDPSILADGDILVVRLSSLEAPFWANAELIDASSGSAASVDPGTVPEAQLVYAASPLIDGGVVLVRHRVGGGVSILRATPGQSLTELADLEAATVAVSPDGDWLAWIDGEAVRLAPTRSPNKPTELGPGSMARFAPDGSLVLVLGDQSAAVVDLDGNRFDEASTSACWIGDGRGCRP
jgi:hypothetical protein